MSRHSAASSHWRTLCRPDHISVTVLTRAESLPSGPFGGTHARIVNDNLHLERWMFSESPSSLAATRTLRLQTPLHSPPLLLMSSFQKRDITGGYDCLRRGVIPTPG